MHAVHKHGQLLSRVCLHLPPSYLSNKLTGPDKSWLLLHHPAPLLLDEADWTAADCG